MGYGGVLAIKRNDHSSDYAFDFSDTIQHPGPHIADYTHYDVEDEVDYVHDREAHHDHVDERLPHNVQYDYVEREADFSHYEDEDYHGYQGFDYSHDGFEYFYQY